MAAPDDSPKSRDRLSLAGPAGPPGTPMPHAFDRSLEGLQDIGLNPPIIVEHFRRFWKHYGLRRAVLLSLAISLPLWRYEWMPAALSAGVETMAESIGAELKVDDWSSDWFDIAVTGEDIRLEVRGPYTESWVLAADKVELDWSLVRGLRNTFKRAGALLGGESPPDEPVHRIRIHNGSLHLERLLSGRWNWQDAVSTSAIAGLAITDGQFRVPTLEADKLTLEWVEHLPGDSGGGLIEQKTSALNLTKVTLRVTDLLVPEDTRDNPTAIAIDGFTSDGSFSVDGRMNFARWMMGQHDAQRALAPPGAGLLRRVSATEPGAQWMPSFTASISLNNVGAAALARIIASDASLVMASGTISGHIKLASVDGVMTCDIDVDLHNVSYAANPRSSYVRTRRAEVERGVKDLLINDHVSRQCRVDSASPDVRVASVLHTEITGDAVKSAPIAVQAAAGFDRLRFVSMDPQARSGAMTSAVSESIGRAVGGEQGAAIARDLAKPDSPTGNAMTRGVKSVGRTIGGIFGGKKKK